MNRILEKKLREAVQVEYDIIDRLLYLSGYIDDSFTEEEQMELIGKIDEVHRISYSRAMQFIEYLRQVKEAEAVENFTEVLEHIRRETEISKENLNRLF